MMTLFCWVTGGGDQMNFTFLSPATAETISGDPVGTERIQTCDITSNIIQYQIFHWRCFSEIKGDIGMSPHEKEGEQGDAYTKTETHS